VKRRSNPAITPKAYKKHTPSKKKYAGLLRYLSLRGAQRRGNRNDEKGYATPPLRGAQRRGNRNDEEGGRVFFRHCEERSDEAIQQHMQSYCKEEVRWIASLPLAMTKGRASLRDCEEPKRRSDPAPRPVIARSKATKQSSNYAKSLQKACSIKEEARWIASLPVIARSAATKQSSRHLQSCCKEVVLWVPSFVIARSIATRQSQ
jgi:hypothetical protein